MMMFWVNSEFFIDDTKLEMEYITPKGKVDRLQNKMMNFQPDSFRDLGLAMVEGGAETTTPPHVVHIHNVTASEDMEMQPIDVTWTKDQGGGVDIVYADSNRGGMSPMSLSVPGQG